MPFGSRNQNTTEGTQKKTLHKDTLLFADGILLGDLNIKRFLGSKASKL